MLIDRRVATRLLLLLACVTGLVSGRTAVAHAQADARAYELVSPVRKFGYDVGGNSADGIVDIRADPSGQRLTYTGYQPLESARAGSHGAFLAERHSDGWGNTGLIGTPEGNQLGNGLPGADGVLMGTTPDQRVAVYWDSTSVPWGSLKVRRADGSSVSIAYATASDFEICFGIGVGGGCPSQAFFGGISDDGRHVVYTSAVARVDGIATSGNDILYEWVDDGSNGGAGSTRVVNRTNESGLQLLDAGPAALGSNRSESYLRDQVQLGGQNGVSSDGRRIFFQNPSVTGPLYMREDGERTVELSRPTAGYSPATAVSYLAAAADGSRVYFWADGALSDGAPRSGGIYSYDTGDRVLSFVAPARGDGGMAPTSLTTPDATVLYFTDGADLHVSDGRGVRLAVERASVGQTLGAGGLFTAGCATANVSTDGRFLTFSGRVGAIDNLQVYQFDARTMTLTKLSEPRVPDPGPYVATLGAGCGSGFFARSAAKTVMSADGATVFFDSTADLVPQDSNGRRDVYMWTRNGQLALVSSGQSDSESTFSGTDPGAVNAFFVTRERLTPNDGDEVDDIYSARVGGGFRFPAVTECTDDGCQGPPTNAPSAPAAATGAAQMNGNVRRTAGTRPVSTAPTITLPARSLRRAARTGRLRVVVRTVVGGPVRVELWRMRRGDRRLAARSVYRSAAGAKASITLRLSRGTRRALDERGRLSLQLRVHQAVTGGATRRLILVNGGSAHGRQLSEMSVR